VLQKAVLFKGTIRDNLKWGNPAATEAEMQEALAIAQAKEFVDAKEGGLDYRIEQGGKNLSGGQRQRLTIARAVVKKPEILILDDSASALDFATDAKLRMAIQKMSGNMTVFIVSQRAASIQYADRILVLDDGRIAGVGTHRELLESCEVYQEIYYSQFKREEAQA
jgi:ABC-type multidrug transport system fused ATPase/permease subunit